MAVKVSETGSGRPAERPAGSIAPAILGGVAGGLAWVPLTGILVGPPLATSNPVSTYELHSYLYNFYLGGTVLFAIFAVLLAAWAAGTVRGPAQVLARGGALVASAGFVALALGVTISVGMVDAVATSTFAPSASDAIYQATLWLDAGTAIGVLGAALIGAGTFILGYVTWGAKASPEWSSIVLSAGGVFGLLTFVAPVLFAGTLIAVSTFSLTICVYALRHPAEVASATWPMDATERSGREGSPHPETTPEELRSRARVVLVRLRDAPAPAMNSEKAVAHLQKALELLREDELEQAEGHIRLAESYASAHVA